MKITGIIAEYNPFHNGHAYQIEKIKKETGSDHVIIAMSGDFVQRGEPAIIDKYKRCEMALSCGADLVMELPALWASSSAEYFAKAGVALFEQMGCVDKLCFGVEASNTALLEQIADILLLEPSEYQNLLSSNLKEGMNFPAARMKALSDYISEYGFPYDSPGTFSGIESSACSMEAVSEILSAPNNILAIEYMKALKSCHSKIRPYPILRNGAGYHDTDILLKNASASAIRLALKESGVLDIKVLSSAIPQAARDIFSEALSSSSYMDADDFSGILSYLLLLYSTDELSAYADCTQEVANRLKKNLASFSSFTQFAALNRSKDITLTRMNRIFTHILLHITSDDYLHGKEFGYVPYLRPLGFKKSSSCVLSEIKKHASVPLIGKTADAKKVLSSDAWRIFEKDIFAANLYEQISAQKNRTLPRSEFTREIVLL